MLEEPGAFVWPLFETFGADILRTPEALDVLDSQLLDDLLGVYNRLRSSNELMDDYREMVAGPTVARITGYSNPPVVPPIFANEQDDLREQLVGRVDELAALDATVLALNTILSSL